MKSLDGVRTQNSLLIGLFQVSVCACSYVSGHAAPGGVGAVGQACSWVTPGCETLGWPKGVSEGPGPWSMVHSLLSILKNKDVYIEKQNSVLMCGREETVIVRCPHR